MQYIENLRHPDLTYVCLCSTNKYPGVITCHFTMLSDIHIDAKAREAYSTGQNVYVPSPQVSDVYVHMQVATRSAAKFKTPANMEKT